MEDEVKDFYNKYGIREWNRLEENNYSKINFLLHMHFIEKFLFKGIKILDAGCGAGRYSIEFAKRGCKVTLFDISDEQLKIAKEKIDEAGVNENIEGIFQGDIRDLSQFENEQFDLVVCYGAPLSYVLEKRETAIIEFSRVLNKNGFDKIVLGGSPCFSCGNLKAVEELGEDEKAFNTILQIEIETYTKPTMVDCGEFLLARGVRKN